MLRYAVRIFFKLVFVGCLLAAFFSQDCLADRKKRVLVLHSYHQGLEWTDNISRGIQSVFSSFTKLYEIHYEYLDTKRNTGKEYVDQLIHFILTKHSHMNYEVVIIADNNALEFMNTGKIVFPGNPPVVFCGINNYSEKLTDGIDKVTGVIEAADHRGTIELMRELHPQRKHIIVILDQTPTGDAIREEMRHAEREYKGMLEFEFMRNFILEEIPDKLASLGDNDLIYLLTFNRDRNNNFVSYAEGVELISESAQVPIYGAWDFYLGKGIVGGRILSGYLQGKKAAELALKILNGNQASDLRLINESPTRYMFDYVSLKKYGIDLSLLPADGKIINMPATAYEKFKPLMIGITVASFCIAFFLLFKFKRQQSLLQAEHAQAIELEKKVYERTKELEIANQELERLSNMDGLTQLYNRRYFDENLEVEIRRLQRLSAPVSLLICDIDYFKRFNDSYGHLAGDDCIRLVVASIQTHCSRISDIAARFGGEEFAVILPHTKAKGAMTIAEHIRRDVELKAIPHETSLIKDIVTISIGVASIIPDEHTLPSTIISMADKALYESKNGGRNRVTLNTDKSTIDG